jgi:serine/threonine protein kinase
MYGGAIIGQGTYGCVFDPPLLCKDAVALQKESKNTTLGKLSLSWDIENEIYASKILSDIPKADSYFVLPNLNSVCVNPVPMKNQPDQEGIQECEAIKVFGTNDLVHYTMPFGGITIHSTFEKNPTKVFPFRMIVKHILEACSFLTLNGLVHYDLHSNNILLDSKTQIPRLIDFGFSFSAQLLTDKIVNERWKVYSPSAGMEPPEITVANGIRKGIKFDRIVKDVISQKRPLKNLEQYFGLSRSSQLRDFVSFWNSSQATKKKDWLAFFRVYWPAFDAWGVGNIVLHLYMNALNIKEIQKQSDWLVIVQRLKEILRGLLRMDPRKRLDCVEALAIFSPESFVVSSPSGRAWLEKKEEMRNEL